MHSKASISEAAQQREGFVTTTWEKDSFYRAHLEITQRLRSNSANYLNQILAGDSSAPLCHSLTNGLEMPRRDGGVKAMYPARILLVNPIVLLHADMCSMILDRCAHSQAIKSKKDHTINADQMVEIRQLIVAGSVVRVPVKAATSRERVGSGDVGMMSSYLYPVLSPSRSGSRDRDKSGG